MRLALIPIILAACLLTGCEPDKIGTITDSEKQVLKDNNGALDEYYVITLQLDDGTKEQKYALKIHNHTKEPEVDKRYIVKFPGDSRNKRGNFLLADSLVSVDSLPPEVKIVEEKIDLSGENPAVFTKDDEIEALRSAGKILMQDKMAIQEQVQLLKEQIAQLEEEKKSGSPIKEASVDGEVIRNELHKMWEELNDLRDSVTTLEDQIDDIKL